MEILIDTGILLRLIDKADAQHQLIRHAVDRLIANKEGLYTANQNIAEYWNVASRPKANNGLELPVSEVAKQLRQFIDPICVVLPEQEVTCLTLRSLAESHQVQGKQIHDARLVALMLNWELDRILTLNARDFLRYADVGITVVTPQDILQP